ncbi:MAG TPA: ABC transporter ATP-binding protein [Steroidobacteraceae bacterium]
MSISAVSAQQLGKSIAGRAILRDVTIAADTGDVVGVLGKNGAGKTTLLETLLGFGPVSAGTAQIFGADSLTMPQAIRARIGFVPQQDELIDMLSGEQQIELVASFYASWDRALAQRLLQAWQIPQARRVSGWSVGERQKLSTLLALAHRPELLVLDEPVASLDPVARRQFLQEIIDLAADGSRTVLFSTHIVADLERVANKVWILKEGQLLWQGTLDALKESVVRLHIRSDGSLPQTLSLPHAQRCRIEGQHATVTVTHWAPEQRAALAERLAAEIEVEPLALEDIFLELHA